MLPQVASSVRALGTPRWHLLQPLQRQHKNGDNNRHHRRECKGVLPQVASSVRALGKKRCHLLQRLQRQHKNVTATAAGRAAGVLSYNGRLPTGGTNCERHTPPQSWPS